MSIVKSMVKISVTASVVLLVLAMVSSAAYAQMPSFPMRLDITINGMPGSSCHLQVYNASGIVYDNPSAGFRRITYRSMVMMEVRSIII